MRHRLFAATALLLAAVMGITAQPHLRKVDPRLSRAASTEVGPLVSVIVTATDADAVAGWLQRQGQRATAISPIVLTARVAPALLPVLAAHSMVLSVRQPAQMKALMTEARAMTGADRAQRGDDLDTPYTGRGVVIGIIDQGFEYRHIAFLNDQGDSRVVALWNRNGYSSGTDGDPTTEIPSTGDGINSTAHATHVAGIAAGSRIAENDWWGIAPEADLVMIPSEFDEAEVLEDVKFVSDLAHERQQPWVVNMSFGTMLGPHDGTSPGFSAIDHLITSQPGGMVVAAVGNDGESLLHANHTFLSDGETVSLLGSPGRYGLLMDLWSQTADSASHLTVRPFVYHGQQQEFLGDDDVSQIITQEIAPHNQKEHFFIQASTAALNRYGGGAQLGLEITGDAGATFHAWTTQGFGTISSGPDERYVGGDHAYMIGDPACSLPHGVAVAAFNSTVAYTNASGQTQKASYGDVGDICSFSNSGPSLHGVPQPTVAAPGAMVRSALSKYEMGFTRTASHITDDVKRGLKHFYYGAYAGTSMATPVVTGAIALWLQANPNLTHSQIHEILRATSSHDELTGSDEWSAQWGYGKLNIYEGLKMALQLAGHSGVAVERAGNMPVTIFHRRGEWRLLFSSSERSVSIRMCSMGGSLVKQTTIADVNCGQEVVLPTGTLLPGTYTVSISTPTMRVTRKLAVAPQ